MNEMKIEIPTQLIEDVVRMEMIRNLTPEVRDKLIELTVKTALGARKDRYADTSYFQEAITEMIKETAKGVFKEWIEQNQKEIKAALYNYLNDNKQARLTEFCESLAGNITSYGVQVELNLKEKTR